MKTCKKRYVQLKKWPDSLSVGNSATGFGLFVCLSWEVWLRRKFSLRALDELGLALKSHFYLHCKAPGMHGMRVVHKCVAMCCCWNGTWITTRWPKTQRQNKKGGSWFHDFFLFSFGFALKFLRSHLLEQLQINWEMLSSRSVPWQLPSSERGRAPCWSAEPLERLPGGSALYTKINGTRMSSSPCLSLILSDR